MFSFRSSLCVRFTPTELALASMYVAAKFSNIGLPEGFLLTACSSHGIVLARIERTCVHCACVANGVTCLTTYCPGFRPAFVSSCGCGHGSVFFRLSTLCCVHSLAT